MERDAAWSGGEYTDGLTRRGVQAHGHTMVDSKYTPLGSLPPADAERQRQLNKFQRAETLLPSAPLANVVLAPAGPVVPGSVVIFDGATGRFIMASGVSLGALAGVVAEGAGEILVTGIPGPPPDALTTDDGSDWFYST